MPQLPPITNNTFINVTPEKVYETLTTGAGWDSWFTTKAEIDLEGMWHRFYWKNFGGSRETVSQEGKVTHFKPNEEFGIEWCTAKDGKRTQVSFTLAPRGAGTLVRVKEEGYLWEERDARIALSCASGWGEAMTLLKFYLEHGVTYGDVPAE